MLENTMMWFVLFPHLFCTGRLNPRWNSRHPHGLFSVGRIAECRHNGEFVNDVVLHLECTCTIKMLKEEEDSSHAYLFCTFSYSSWCQRGRCTPSVLAVSTRLEKMSWKKISNFPVSPICVSTYGRTWLWVDDNMSIVWHFVAELQFKFSQNNSYTFRKNGLIIWGQHFCVKFAHAKDYDHFHRMVLQTLFSKL